MCLGIPGQIIDIVDDENSIAKVNVSGVKRNVNVFLVRPEGNDARPELYGRRFYR